MTGVESDVRTKQLAFTTANLIPGMIAYWNSRQQCVYSNDAYFDWFGCRPKDMIGIGMKELLGDLYPQNLPFIEGALAGKKQIFERSIRIPDGQVRNSLAIYTPDIVDAVVVGFTVQVVDVTPLRQREASWEKLARERAGFSQMAENCPDIVSRFDRDLHHIYVSREIERVTGIPSASFIGKTNEQLGMEPGLCARWNRLLRDVFARGEKETIDFTFRREGVEENYSAVCVPEFSSSGEVETVLCVARNVTELFRAADLAKGRESRLNLITEAANMGIFEWDFPDGLFHCKNKTAAELLGLKNDVTVITSSELLQRILVSGDATTFQQGIQDSAASGATFRQVCAVRQPTGRPQRWVEFAGRVEPSDATVSPKCVGFLHDVTDEVSANQLLSVARDRAEKDNAAKDRFLATISHELRTPLAPALLLLKELEATHELSPVVKRDLGVIREQVELEARLVDDLLDLARVTNGKLRVTPEPCDPDVVVERALWTIAEEFSVKRITVTADFAKDPSAVLADPVRLQQVCWNLLRNAAKFTPAEGQVAIRSTYTDHSWILSVSDSGIGLAATDLTRVFECFVQIGSERAGKSTGLGLGLAIAATLVREHGGRIWAESEGPGKGATFKVELPTTSPRRATEANATPVIPETAPRRLLVVEDHLDTLRAITRLLSLRGHEVHGAHTVAEAKAIADAARVDLLICDLNLPDGHGSDLLRYISERQAVGSIAISGDRMEEKNTEWISAGFDRHLIKPFSIQDLEQAIAIVANRAASCQAEPT